MEPASITINAHCLHFSSFARLSWYVSYTRSMHIAHNRNVKGGPVLVCRFSLQREWPIRWSSLNSKAVSNLIFQPLTTSITRTFIGPPFTICNSQILCKSYSLPHKYVQCHQLQWTARTAYEHNNHTSFILSQNANYCFNIVPCYAIFGTLKLHWGYFY